MPDDNVNVHNAMPSVASIVPPHLSRVGVKRVGARKLVDGLLLDT